MPTFDRNALRKGAKAIDEALEARGSGEFKPFLPNIYWRDDQDYRYLMFLNPLEEILEVDFHPFIDCDDGVPHMCISHTDKSFGSGKDEIQATWGYKPRLTGLAIAVELDPITEVIKGYPKPVGFEIKTTTFDRKIRDEAGKATDEVEEVTVPLVGLVTQSPYNFFNQLRTIDANEAAIHATPLKITRVGKQSNVSYTITHYDTITPDLSGLLDFVENMSYVTDPETLINAIEDAGEDTEKATVAIGDYLLYKRVEELADVDLYNEILGKITKPARFQDQKEGKEKTKRPSQRRARSSADPETTAEAPKARSRKDSEAETKESPRDARMAKLRARSRAAKKSEESDAE